MKGHYFISYSSADGKDFARRLTDRLIGGPPSYAAWLDVRELRAGSDWDRQVRDAIRESQALLFVMTADSVRDDSRCKDEWVWALRHKKPIMPLKFASEAELPFQLGARQYVDFTVGFDVGLARLRDEIDRLTSPDGALRELRLRLADAEREIPRTRDEGERMRIVQDMEVLRARIAEQERVVADPTGATEAATIRIVADLERQRNPKRLRPRTVRQTKIVNQLPVAIPTYFQDRSAETELLVEFLRAEDARMATVVGRGGVGKTATVCRLLRAMEIGRLPDGLDEASGELALHGVVYLRTPSAHPVSFANLFTDLCQLLSAKTAEPLLRRYRDPHETPGGLMFALLEAFPTGRWVVLLDNFEDKVDPVTSAVTENALDEALRTMLSAPEHFVKLIITTRIVPQPLLLHQPGVQQRIDLDDGLPSPFAERLLRARDPDGRLGLKSARLEQLSQARERTRGYPRALEALAGILSADRNSTLSELLDQTTHLPENVVTALVGEAFLRLDPLAQQVMQTLAIFPVPVPAVAVDFLMQPFQSAINAAPVLSRLVNMQFVRRDADCYFLHQIDRDYVLGRIPEGKRIDRETDPPPFTATALRGRGADYFARTQKQREEWRTLDDLAPQLAEFELRCQGGDYDRAGQVLLAIDLEYLIQWGHYRYTIDLHTRLHSHLINPRIRIASTLNLGSCHYFLGDYHRALELYAQALAIAKENKDRESEAVTLGRLGLCHVELGQIRAAIDLYETAVTITREVGNRQGQSSHLGNLGLCRTITGQFHQAVELHKQALAMAREAGDQQSEISHLVNLGLCYAALGQPREASALYEQALTVARRIGFRLGEAACLNYIGVCYVDGGQWGSAITHHRKAIEIADAIGSAQVQAEARHDLAQSLLWAGDLSAARDTIDTARTHQYPSTRAGIALLDGIIHLRREEISAAQEAFREAIAHADERIQHNPADYNSLDTKALALAGLTLTGSTDHTADAASTFRTARSVTAALGVTTRIHRYLDTLAPVDSTGVLFLIRPSAAGYKQ